MQRKSRISAKFAELQAKRQKALVAYAMAGFPSEKSSEAAIHGMIYGGADVIEIGFPFSDPLADGRAIQMAATTSLKRKTTFAKFLRMVKRIRARHPDTPLVLMTYANIMYNLGYEKAAKMLSDAGIDGIILPDMAVDESAAYVAAARQYGIDTIFLAAPNTSNMRLQKLVQASSGFLYAVAIYGTTGVRTVAQQTGDKRDGKGTPAIPAYTTDTIRRIQRAAGKQQPVGVGFGVATPADVAAYISAGADAVIVGSAYTKVIKDAQSGRIESDVTAFTKRLKAATHRLWTR